MSVSDVTISGNIPVKDSQLYREFGEEDGNFLGDGNRPVPAARAADSHSECFFAGGAVLFNKKLQQGLKMVKKRLGLGALQHIVGNLFHPAGLWS